MTVKHVSRESYQEITRLLDLARDRDQRAKADLPLSAKLALKREAKELREKAMAIS